MHAWRGYKTCALVYFYSLSVVEWRSRCKINKYNREKNFGSKILFNDWVNDCLTVWDCWSVKVGELCKVKSHRRHKVGRHYTHALFELLFFLIHVIILTTFDRKYKWDTALRFPTHCYQQLVRIFELFKWMWLFGCSFVWERVELWQCRYILVHVQYLL